MRRDLLPIPLALAPLSCGLWCADLAERDPDHVDRAFRCEVDDDCCAVEGECDDDRPQVCAPFESTGVRRCFLSCEAQVVGDRDENDYCAEFAHRDFGCRSTGGGSANRKVCVP